MMTYAGNRPKCLYGEMVRVREFALAGAFGMCMKYLSYMAIQIGACPNGRI